MSLKNNFHSIEASIMLAVDDKTRHWLYFQTTPRTPSERQASLHKDDFGGASVSVTQQIYDGRSDDGLTLDETSFELVQCPTALSTDDFYKLQGGDDELRARYYGEVETFVQKRWGCDKVICVHSQVRNAERMGTDGVQGYAGGAPHTDSSAVSGDLFALEVLQQGQDDNNAEKYQRYCYLNLWRNIGQEPIQNDHLAVLDERSTVKPDDYVVKDLFGDGYTVVQYGLNARHASAHKWYYFPNMTRQEAILFKQMDSDWTKPGRICFHMSVSDPNASGNAKPRESIEVRMLCLWKQASVDSMPTQENLNRDLIRDPLEYAQELAGTSLQNASFIQLLVALLKKLPIVGRLVGFILGDASAFAPAAKPYTGRPSDYLNQFTTAIDYLPHWPPFAKTWVKSTMKQQGKQAGIVSISKALVDDSMGYQKTKAFTAREKAEIVEYLLASDKYMAIAEKHLAPLAFD